MVDVHNFMPVPRWVATRGGVPDAGSLEAPTKHVVWFERSAHTPHLDEPGKFRDLLLRVRDGQLEEHDMASWSDEHGGRP